jgi:hypothetical protein
VPIYDLKEKLPLLEKIAVCLVYKYLRAVLQICLRSDPDVGEHIRIRILLSQKALCKLVYCKSSNYCKNLRLFAL